MGRGTLQSLAEYREKPAKGPARVYLADAPEWQMDACYVSRAKDGTWLARYYDICPDGDMSRLEQRIPGDVDENEALAFLRDRVLEVESRIAQHESGIQALSDDMCRIGPSLNSAFARIGAGLRMAKLECDRQGSPDQWDKIIATAGISDGNAQWLMRLVDGVDLSPRPVASTARGFIYRTDDFQMERLKRAAERHGMTPEEMVKHLVDEWVDATLAVPMNAEDPEPAIE